MITIGLTGSIGMGKSTTAQIFAREGVPVWDADAAVHRLYAPDGEGAKAVLARFPETAGEDGGVDRTKLAGLALKDPSLLAELEAIVHPLVRDDQMRFLAKTNEIGVPMALLDIPLLAEGGMAGLFTEVVVVTADEEVRRARVLERPGMTDGKLASILERQASEEDRLQIADHVIRTDKGLEHAKDQVKRILAAIREKHGLPDPRKLL
ncbi:MAG: dephospho-CoA kinase [Parvularculaceae bacterium]|nr:dephospho-CoA kinase [Parvularculaceae bacterium]